MKKSILYIIMLYGSSFLCLAQPTITSFSPTSGAIDTEVTITGTNFDTTPANNIVFLGATQATVTAASATELTVTVPIGATYQPITVLNNELIAYSATPFVVTFEGPAVYDDQGNYEVSTGRPYSMAIGDLDGDSKTDMVVVDNFISVFRNTSTGTGNISFATKVNYSAGTDKRSVSIGDYDGDGLADFAIVNYGSNTVSVFRNTSPGAGTISFDTKVDFTTGSNPQSVSIGDLDGDGKTDLAVTNRGSNTVSVFRNTSPGAGTISYAAKVDFTTGTDPESIVVGDLDGDGLSDLVVGNVNGSTISIYRNTSSAGTISFDDEVKKSTNSNPKSIAIGDLDNDGKADLAVTNYFTDRVQVFGNTSIPGTLSIGNRGSFNTGTDPGSVAIGDMDGDGKVDIVASNYTASSISVLINTSTGVGNYNFATKVDYATGSNPYLVSIGDYDGDGKTDLAVPSYGNFKVSVLRNTSSDTEIKEFSLAEQNGIAIIDTENHTVDIEVFYDVDVTLLIPTFSLSTGAYAQVSATDQTSGATANNFTNPVTYTITAADGATTQDWIITLSNAPSPPTITSFSPQSGPVGTSVTLIGTNFDTTPASNIVFFGATRATVTAATASELTVTVPMGATYMPITVLVNGLMAYSLAPFVSTFDGAEINTYSFDTKVDFTTGTSPTSVSIGDLDGDGKGDLAVTNGSTGVSVFRNTGTGVGSISYYHEQELSTNDYPLLVSLGDLDGDGKGDLVVANYGSSSISVYRNTSISPGAVSYAAPVYYVTGSSPSRPVSVSVGDLDGDGKADLAVANSENNTVSIFRNTSTSTGTISYNSKVDFTTGTKPFSVSIGDLDGDGKADLAVANLNSNTVSVLRNTSTSAGTISFATKIDYSTGSGPRSVSIGDLDSDGMADLAAANYLTNSVSVLRNTSTGPGSISYATKTDFSTGSSPYSITIGDLDGDGKVDLAVANYLTNSVSVLRNTSTSAGTISFATKIDYSTGSGPRSVSIGDIDSDGKVDLVVANAGSNTVSIFRNTNTSTGIFEFSLTEQAGSATIDEVNHTIDIDVDPLGADVIALVATFTLTSGASAKVGTTDQVNATTSNDFTSPVIYTIIAEDGVTTQDWTVTVTPIASTKTVVTSFSLPDQTKAALIDEANQRIFIEVLFGTDVATLIPTFTLLDAATAKVGSIDQVSGITANDFSSQVTYSITAEDGITTQDWIVVVQNPTPTITTFTPTSGPIGTEVTITGTDFNSTPTNNIVFFGATEAVVTTATTTTLTVIVPAGATYHYITVLTSGLLSNSSVPFVVTFDTDGIDVNSFDTEVYYITGSSPKSVAIGDLDGDGKVDLAVANTVLRNSSTGAGTISYAAKKDYNTGTASISIAIGDLDGDGKADLAVANYGSNSVSVLQNTSTGVGAISYAAKVDYTTGSNPQSVAIGDVDGDGKADLAVTNYGSNTVSVLRNLSTGAGDINYAEKVDYTTGINPWSVAIGDLDGDGKADLAITNYSSSTVSVFRNTSTGAGTISYAAKEDFWAGNSPSSVAIGDLDGDGRADLAVASYGSQSVTVLQNTSTGSGMISFVFKESLITGSNPYSVAIGDLDGDSKVDLAVANYLINSVSVFRNTSTGTGVFSYAKKVDYTTGSSPYSVAIGDVDGDGKADLVTVNYSSSSVSLLRRQVIPSVPIILEAGLVTTTAFTANWEASPRVTNGYYLDVSTSATFEAGLFVPGYENLLVGNVTSYEVNTNLSSGTIYYYQIRAADGSAVSGSSTTESVVTNPLSPPSSIATNVEETSFSTNWAYSVSATGYIVEVTTDAEFNMHVTGSPFTVGDVTTKSITGLEGGTTYYYQVTAVNGNGSSTPSDGQSLITKPAAPVASAINIEETTFTVNWITSQSANGYELDVSTTITFTGGTFVTGYENLSVGNVLIQNVIGLVGGTTYYFRIRAVNTDANLTSDNSGTISVVTKPPLPVASAATAIEETSFSANWESSVSATSYILDVTMDVGLNIHIPGSPFSLGNVITKSVTGLEGGTTYYYRVAAVNGSLVSSPSDPQPLITKPPPPVSSTATIIEETSFSANWLAATSATTYELDVTTDAGFSTHITGSPFTVGNFLTNSVTGLLGGTTYYYQVRAVNSDAGLTSGNSGAQSLITKPSAPVARDVLTSDITSNSFKARWEATTGATSYELEVSKDNFSTFLTGYDPNTLTTTSDIISGLLPETTYKFRVRAKNSAGLLSANSVQKSVTTSVDVSPNQLALSTPSYSATTKNLTFPVSGGYPPYSVVVRHRKILVTAYTEVSLTEDTPGNYSFGITPAMMDELGVEFEISVTDAINAKDSLEGMIFVSFNATQTDSITFKRFGGGEQDWNLFSIPYKLDNMNVNSVFTDSKLGNYGVGWRLMNYRFNNGDDHDYEDFSTRQMEVGVGYWFNAVDAQVKINLAGRQVINQIPFPKLLSYGWNLIGNPYPVNIYWEQVKAGATNITSLFVFDGRTPKKGDLMIPYGGGFVWSDVDTTVNIDPRLANTGGRISASDRAIESNDIDWHEWMLDLKLNVDNNERVIGGFGMHPDASELKDKYDEMMVPRFFSYTDLSTKHDAYFYPWFATDVVPTASNYTWSFTLSSNITEGISNLVWNKKLLENKESNLYLLDKSSGKLLDMKSQNNYSVDLRNGDFKFDIYFVSNGESFMPSALLLGNAYPNPTSTKATIPVIIPTTLGKTKLSLSIYDINGKHIQTLSDGIYAPGYYEFTWNMSGSNMQSVSGVFIYRLILNNSGIAPIQKKLIVR